MTTGSSSTSAADIYKNTFLDPELQEAMMMTMMEDDTEGQCPQIWTYVTRHPLPASSDYPIAQSYVDIVLRGCLTISTSFAQEFIQTTKGWYPHSSSQEQKQPSSSSSSSNYTTATTTTTTNSIMKEKREQKQQQLEEAGGWWVEDRHNPLYIRADREYSLHHAPLLDKLLMDNLPRSGGSGDETSWLLAKRIQRGRTPHHHHHHKKKKGRMM